MRVNVTPQWYANQYKHPETTKETEYTANIRPNLKTLEVRKQTGRVTLQLSPEKKRNPVFDGDKWVSSTPKQVYDFCDVDYMSNVIITNLIQNIKNLKTDNTNLKDKLAEMNKNIDKNYKDLMSINTDSNLNEEIMRLYIDEDSEGSNLKLEENTKTDDKKPDT